MYRAELPDRIGTATRRPAADDARDGCRLRWAAALSAAGVPVRWVPRASLADDRPRFLVFVALDSDALRLLSKDQFTKTESSKLTPGMSTNTEVQIYSPQDT